MPKTTLTPEELAALTARLKTMDISTIAGQISRDWRANSPKGIYFGAVPYLNAMQSMGTVDDAYGADDGRSIVNYFLSNAQTYRGPLAKAIKAELISRVRSK